MKYVLLVAMLILCGTAYADETETPFHMPTPDGWLTETIHFPLGFAPQVDYDGFEELRFAPGWRNVEAEDFWTYAFVWWVPDSTIINAEVLQSDLDAYYRGLASDSDNPDIASQVNAIESDAGSRPTFQGIIKTIDTFTTNKPVSLNFHAEVISCEAQGRLAVFFQISPQPADHPIWLKLHGLLDEFRCEL
ncbi:MAG: hypothetical protein ACI9UK_000975 [Candidatus Krumholzibacteriia bacterium]|jgi:hypothetical protein